MISVAVIDDQALMRDAFTMICDAQPDFEVVGSAADGRAAVELCQNTNPDIALMDIRMPDMDGIAATRSVTSNPSISTRVIVLTMFDLDEYVYEAVRAGASGFLLKDTPAAELIDAVRIIAKGEALLAPSITRQLMEEFARQPEPPAQPISLPTDLTEREHEAHVHRRGNSKNSCEPAADEARRTRPGAGSCARLRVGSGRSRSQSQ